MSKRKKQATQQPQPLPPLAEALAVLLLVGKLTDQVGRADKASKPLPRSVVRTSRQIQRRIAGWM